MSPRAYPSLLARVEANSIALPFSGCWIWMGYAVANNRGELYGKMSVRIHRGRRRGKVGSVFVHRAVCADKLGVPLSRLRVARHKCDVSLCCNPAHLVGGTNRQNVRDAIERGRR